MKESPKRIVYIEDDEELIDLVNIILARHGYSVLGATDGRQGLDLIRHESPDLVLLDLMIPDMDGWEIYQRMKANEATRDIPVIVITAKAHSIDKVLGLTIAKVEDYISKPFSPKDLLESIEKVLSQSANPA